MLRNKLLWITVIAVVIAGVGCRYDMQDQPRYKVYKPSTFFPDNRSSRDFPEGTVARGQLRADKALYTGKTEDADPNAQAQTTTDASGNTVVTTFPGVVTEFPVPVTKELVDRGQERYTVFCSVCHGPVGNGDGMIVRRGFVKPPSYNDDRLRNAPVGHFYDVITNGWGRMNSYAAQIPVADRWAIVAYIRALQISQHPNADAAMTKPAAASNPAPAGTTTTNTAASKPAAAANTNTGGAK